MKTRIVALILTLGLAAIFVAPFARAFDAVNCDNLPKDQCSIVSDDKLNSNSKNNIIWNIVQFIFILLGGVAVIMIIVGGIQYATSQGNSGAVEKAKNTILYAVIGLVVALFATGIVTFVINSVT